VDEIHKIAHYAPGMRVYIRLSVDNSGAVVPLDKKFGVSGEQAVELLMLARSLGLEPIGLSFHVGSQCINAANWVQAIRECGTIWQHCAREGIVLHFLDLGGGFPIHTDESVPTFDDIGAAVRVAIAEFIPETPNLRVILEPGRGLTGANGVMVMTVVGRAQRGDKTWLYLDGGVFNGMTEVLEGFSYPVNADDSEAPRTHVYTLAGPSCDSFDTIMRDVALPETQIGDRLYFLNSGAYTTEYASNFNGFDVPRVEIL
jgi:ornithine decarboxylase